METENKIQQTDATAIQQVQPDHPPIPIDAPLMTRLAMMMERGIKIDTDQMSKMLEIAERLKAIAAKEAYAADFAVVQARIDGAVKTARNPQTGSMYAKLEGVIEASKPAYTAQGFSVVFYEGETEKEDHIRVYADILHKDGHRETKYYDVPLGGVGIKGVVNMTAIHAKATSVTYGRRYLLCMIWNIPTQDDDGNAAGKKPTGIPQPNKQEQKVLDLICKKLNSCAPHGKCVDMKKIIAITLEMSGKFAAKVESADQAAQWFIDANRPEIYMDLPKDDFDEFAEKYHKEHDVPDGPPEPDEQDVPYECKKCGLKFDTPKKAADCIC